tara:strand:- start:1202 stop:2290 length:1089 start_codon:yes stop_codon:yes gene_type:complete
MSKENENYNILKLKKSTNDEKNKKSFPTELISRSEVNAILSSNFGRISTTWFNFLTSWNHNAYRCYNDMDKYLILIFLIQKTLKHYSDILVYYDEKTLYDTKNNFEIEKINLIEIAEDLKIPKETVRRKINEMEKFEILKRDGKKIFLTQKAFQAQRPIQTIKNLSSLLSVCSNYLSTENWFGEKVKSDEIDRFIRKNFTLTWNFYFRFLISLCVRTRKFYGDLETYIVAGTVYVNHAARLRDRYSMSPLSFKNSGSSKHDMGENNYIGWMKTISSTKIKITGINASSISEITGVPRATVIRKLKSVEKRGLIFKDKNQLYTLGKKYKENLMELQEMFIANQIDFAKFVATFFELYKNKSLH